MLQIQMLIQFYHSVSPAVLKLGGVTYLHGVVWEGSAIRAWPPKLRKCLHWMEKRCCSTNSPASNGGFRYGGSFAIMVRATPPLVTRWVGFISMMVICVFTWLLQPFVETTGHPTGLLWRSILIYVVKVSDILCPFGWYLFRLTISPFLRSTTGLEYSAWLVRQAGRWRQLQTTSGKFSIEKGLLNQQARTINHIEIIRGSDQKLF